MSQCDRSWIRSFATTPQYRFLAEYRRLLNSLGQTPPKDRAEVVRRLFESAMDMVADYHNLLAAFNHVERQGGEAIGRDGLRAGDFSTPTMRRFVRELREQLLSGTFTQGKLRSVPIPKRSGSGGRRTIYVQPLRDRVVSRALTQIIEPLIALDAEPFSFSRPQLGRWRAVANASYLAEREGRTMWIAEDLQDAFDRVPRKALAEILASRCPNDRVCQLVLEVCKTPNKRGIMQGAAISPLLLDVYLDATLHRPWRKRFPRTPLLRYADDLVIACQPDENIQEAYAALQGLSTSAGFELKHGRQAAVRDLQRSDATWLGYRVCLEDGQLAIRPGKPIDSSGNDNEPRRDLLDSFRGLHDRSHGWMHVGAALRGYVGQLGPVHPYVDREAACRSLIDVAREAEFDVLESVDELLGTWDTSHQRFRQMAVAIRSKLAEMRQPSSGDQTSDQILSPELEAPQAFCNWEPLFNYIRRCQKSRRSAGAAHDVRNDC